MQVTLRAAAAALAVVCLGTMTSASAESALEEQVREASRLLDDVEAPAAVFVGEAHDRMPYHVNQLAVIRALRENGQRVAVGLEMFQTPFQAPLDRYVAGEIDLSTMLEETEYYTRWRYDARLYQPIFEYAREHGLPLVALNAAREVTDRVSRVGLAGLGDEERVALPDEFTPPAPDYRALLEEVFREHQELADSDIERFIDVQMAWDETMALSSARFLEQNPDHVLVVLAGIQHVANGHGIPQRLRKHVDARSVIVLSEAEMESMPAGADYYLALGEAVLSEPGRMGVLIRPSERGAAVDGFADGSPAKIAGLEPDDYIVEIDGRLIRRFADIKLALWDKAPGETVEVTVERTEGARTTYSFALY